MDRKHQRYGTRVVGLAASRSFVAKTLAAGAHSGQHAWQLRSMVMNHQAASSTVLTYGYQPVVSQNRCLVIPERLRNPLLLGRNALLFSA